MTSGEDRSKIIVTTTPWARVTPHLRELYGAMEEVGVQVRSDSLRHWAVRAAKAGDPDVFHLNWLDHLAGPTPVMTRAASAARLLLYLLIARIRRRRVWWTVHNVEPHDRPRAVLFATTQFLVFLLVDTVHFLSASAEAGFLSKYRVLWPLKGKTLVTTLPTDQRDSVPLMGGLQAERQGGIVTFVLYGNLRRAKAVVEVIESFSVASADSSLRRLIVAGTPVDVAYGNAILRASGASENIDTRLHFHDDTELDSLLAGSDWGVFLYDRVSNSGSIIHAFSVGLPALAYDLPFFQECFGPEPRPGVLVPYRRAMTGSDWDDLAELARSASHIVMRRRAVELAAEHSPAAVAAVLLDHFSTGDVRPITEGASCK